MKNKSSPKTFSYYWRNRIHFGRLDKLSNHRKWYLNFIFRLNFDIANVTLYLSFKIWFSLNDNNPYTCGQFWRQRGKLFWREDKSIFFDWENTKATERRHQREYIGEKTYFRCCHRHPYQRWFVIFLLLYLTPFPNLHLHHFCNPTVIC